MPSWPNHREEIKMENGYKCDKCDKEFPTKSALHNHVRKAHGTAEEKPKAAKKKGMPKPAMWAIGVVLLGVIAFVIFLAMRGVGPVTPTTTTIPSSGGDLPATNAMIVLNDKRCTSCSVTNILSQLQGIFPKLTVKQLDYNDAAGLKLYKDINITYLPAIMFTDDVKTNANFSKIQNYLEPAGKYLNLRIGAAYDPNPEICDNGKDDNGNGLVDCADAKCTTQYTCTILNNKRAKPLVEVFVMSHCPFGTQTEKGLLPVLKLLGNKIDWKVRFIDYSMHMEKEVMEEWAQYCIQKEQSDKYYDYLVCFMEAGDGAGCLTKAGIDTTRLGTCKTAADTEFKILENWNNQSLWTKDNQGKPQFPRVFIDKALDDKYGIHGSPGLAINEAPVNVFNRDAASLLKMICQAFAVAPAECSQQLSSAAPSPGFGYAASPTTASSSGACG